MYVQVASKLVVTATTSYTQAVSLAGANAAYCTIQTIGVASGSSSGVGQLQVGNDLENWNDVSGATAGITAVGGTVLTGTALAAQYCRLKLSVTGTLIVAADINTANL